MAIRTSRLDCFLGEGKYIIDFFNIENIDIVKILRCILYSEIKNCKSYDGKNCRNNDLDIDLAEFFQREYTEQEDGNEGDYIAAIKDLKNFFHFMQIIGDLHESDERLVSEDNKKMCDEFYNNMNADKVNKGDNEKKKMKTRVLIPKYMEEFMIILDKTKYSNIFLNARKETVKNEFRNEILKNEKLSNDEKDYIREIYKMIDFAVIQKRFRERAGYKEYLKFWGECITEYTFRYSDKEKKNMTEKEIIFYFLLEDFFGFYYFKRISEFVSDCMNENGFLPSSMESMEILQKNLYAIFVIYDPVLRVDFAKYTIDKYFFLLKLEEKGIIKVDWKKWSVKVQEIIETGVEFCKQWEDRQLKDEDNKKCKKNIPDSNLKWYSMSMFKYYMDEKNRIKDDEKKDDIQSKIGEISSGSSKCWHWKMIKGWIEYYWNYDFYYDLDYQNNIWPFEPELDEFEYEKDYEKRMIVERVTIEKLDSYDFIIRRWSVEP